MKYSLGKGHGNQRKERAGYGKLGRRVGRYGRLKILGVGYLRCNFWVCSSLAIYWFASPMEGIQETNGATCCRLIFCVSIILAGG